MNRMQRIAWCQLGFVGGAVVFSVIAMGYFVWRYEYTFSEAWWIAVGYAAPLLILAVIAPPVIFRKRRGRVDCDERDLMIDCTAARIAFGAAFVFFIGVCVTTWIVVGVDSMIPAVWLTRIVYIGWVTAVIAHALTTVVFYSRGGLANE